MSVQNELDSFVNDVQEIINNTIKIKGQEFADAVAVQFEIFQVGEILGRIVGPLDDKYFSDLAEQCITLVAGISSKVAVGLTIEQVQEAKVMADQLIARRQRVNQKIREEISKNAD
ncbi:hypothetical protein [Polynucleobacter sp. UK-Kesae-W10]|uniref:hypothetical protein n=1 Tax=Polynucleobacter sp. UK-Kesae-W10 TaxID=1819738 RepID=UPI001C0C0C70|nr:hypothetical protein [Polynucleobacter sp. UK-Kesae-W10]MBU3577488.1 hypothetical protein [Polynucleobacter sp. UK-Kesae-W10]